MSQSYLNIAKKEDEMTSAVLANIDSKLEQSSREKTVLESTLQSNQTVLNDLHTKTNALNRQIQFYEVEIASIIQLINRLTLAKNEQTIQSFDANKPNNFKFEDVHKAFSNRAR